MSDEEAGLRADARANRDRILEVAREALAAAPDASLNSIAKAAGVGAGTLYRHFPSRESLLAGVYRVEIDALAALTHTLLEKQSPLDALRLWFDRFAQAGRVKHGIADALHAAVSDQDIQDTFRTLADAVRRLMDACEQSGDITVSVSPEDVLVLLSCVLRIAPTQKGKEQTERILAFIFRSLTARPRSKRDPKSIL